MTDDYYDDRGTIIIDSPLVKGDAFTQKSGEWESKVQRFRDAAGITTRYSDADFSISVTRDLSASEAREMAEELREHANHLERENDHDH
jgi:hypothetical protein